METFRRRLNKEMKNPKFRKAYKKERKAIKKLIPPTPPPLKVERVGSRWDPYWMTALIAAVMITGIVLAIITGCARCRSTNCNAGMETQVNYVNNELKDRDIQKVCCDALTAIALYGGTNCIIKWK